MVWASGPVVQAWLGWLPATAHFRGMVLAPAFENAVCAVFMAWDAWASGRGGRS